jgi:5-methylthioadenosine/S-adenosylhomocysteine deaminase
VLPVSGPAVRDAVVWFDAVTGTVDRVEPGVSEEDASAIPGCELFPDCVLAPGFVNAHSHIEYAAYDALTDGLGFAEWIGDHVRRKRRLGPKEMRASAELGAWESVAGGITATIDASFSGDAASAMAGVGMRGRVDVEVFGRGVGPEVLQAALSRVRDLELDARRVGADIAFGLSPHAPYTVDEALFREVAATGMAWTTHLLESDAEVQLLRHGAGPLAAPILRLGGELPVWGASPVVALADVLGQHVVAVHLVCAEPADLEVLAASGATLAHCPRSNARLGCGVLDLASCVRAGVNVALGTDSPASAGPIDMFAEMRTAIDLQRAVQRDALALTAVEALRMATVAGAAALGRAELGRIEAGSAADVVALRTGPTSDPTAAYVLGGTPADVEAVLVGGKSAWRRDRNALQHARERAAGARALLALPVPRSSASAAVATPTSGSA